MTSIRKILKEGIETAVKKYEEPISEASYEELDECECNGITVCPNSSPTSSEEVSND